MRAHELVALLDPESDDYKMVMASVKFDLGDVADAQALAGASSRTLYEIPAPICLFQISGAVETHWYLGHEVEDGTIWRAFGKGHGDSPLGIGPIEAHFNRNGGEMSIKRRDGRPIPNDESINRVEHNLALAYMAMAQAVEVFSCCNVATFEHQPPKFINAKRIAKGKVPFFSYRTLRITSDAAPKMGEATTATHASPRLHLRRGHIRRLQDDRRIWVRASLVGDKSKGFANKDYAVDHHEGARAAAEAKGRRGA
jgi:hypothetical protein